MKGFVKLRYKNKEKEVIYEEKHNLIVNQAGIITAQLLAESGVSGITKFVVGDDPVDTTDKTTTSLGGNTYTKAIDTITLSTNKITYAFTLSSSEFNGYDIWQFGLTTDDNQLFSILSRKSLTSPPTISKTSDIDVEGEWVITSDVT